MFTKHELETILYTLEGYMIGNDDDKLCDELSAICDKISKELPPIVINLPEGTNLSKVTITDDDYASKVDRLVDNMVASDDNEEEELPELSIQEQLDYVDSRLTIVHDSEGC